MPDKEKQPTYLAGYMRAAGEGRKMSFRASTATLDRHGSKIIPAGIHCENYDKNPIFAWGHDAYGGWGRVPDPENIIGRVVNHATSIEAFDIDVEFVTAEVNPRAEMLYQLTKAGFLNAVSVGIIPMRGHEEKATDGSWVYVIDECDLLEVSLVPIPSNPDALALARSIGEQVNSVDAPTIPVKLRGHSPMDVLTRIGRVLSKANESKLRQADELLNDVLAALDKDDDDSNKTAPPATAADAGVVSGVRDAFVATLIRDTVRSAIRR